MTGSVQRDVVDVVAAVASRWPTLDVASFERVHSWAHDQLQQVSVHDVLTHVTGWQAQGLPAAAEVALLIADLPASTQGPDDVRATGEDEGSARPDQEQPTLIEVPCGVPDAKEPSRATVFVSHALINHPEVSDDAFAVWLLLGQVPGTHDQYRSSPQKWMLRTLGWGDLSVESARRRLRRVRENLERAGAVRTRLVTGPDGSTVRMWHRLMVPTVSHRGHFEQVASENTADVLADHGSSVLRVWLRYAAAAAGRGSVQVTAAEAATRWGQSVSTVRRGRGVTVAAGLIARIPGPDRTEWTGIVPPAEVFHKGVRFVRGSTPDLSGGLGQICPHKEDACKTYEDPVVASATLETPQEVELPRGRPRSPNPSHSPSTTNRHTDGAAKRARSLIAQTPEMSALEPRQRGICRSRLTLLLRQRPHLADDAIIDSLRTRFADSDELDTGPAHATMVTEAIAGLIADTMAVQHRDPDNDRTDHEHHRQVRLIADPAAVSDARAAQARTRLRELAGDQVEPPDWTDPTSDPYPWLLWFLANKTSAAPEPTAAVATLARVARRSLGVEHHAALASAAALISRIAEPIDQARSSGERIPS